MTGFQHQVLRRARPLLAKLAEEDLNKQTADRAVGNLSAGSMNAKLVVISGNTSKSEVPLRSLPLTIGRTRKADLPIGHPRVSREHCVIEEYQGVLLVTDRNSSNGTRINGRSIKQAFLKPGDELSVGPVTFLVSYQHNGPWPRLPQPTAPQTSFNPQELGETATETGTPIPEQVHLQHKLPHPSPNPASVNPSSRNPQAQNTSVSQNPVSQNPVSQAPGSQAPGSQAPGSQALGQPAVFELGGVEASEPTLQDFGHRDALFSTDDADFNEADFGERDALADSDEPSSDSEFDRFLFGEARLDALEDSADVPATAHHQRGRCRRNPPDAGPGRSPLSGRSNKTAQRASDPSSIDFEKLLFDPDDSENSQQSRPKSSRQDESSEK